MTATRKSHSSLWSSVDWITSPSPRRGSMSCGQLGQRISSALSLCRQFSASLWRLYDWFRRRFLTDASVHCGRDPLVACAVVVASPAMSLHSSSVSGGVSEVLVVCCVPRRYLCCGGCGPSLSRGGGARGWAPVRWFSSGCGSWCRLCSQVFLGRGAISVVGSLAAMGFSASNGSRHLVALRSR